MRKILFLIAICLCSCAQPEHSSPLSSLDSVKLDSSAEKVAKSSMADSTILKQQQIVYKGVEFGMTKKQYKKIIPNTFQTIGDYEYLFYPSFNDKGKLYRLDIKSLEQDANYYDTEVKLKMQNLVDVIQKKYGKPSTEAEYPQFFNMSSGYIVFADTWIVGTKTIEIGVGEVYSGSQYYSSCRISDKPMADEVKAKEDADAEKAKQKKSAEF